VSGCDKVHGISGKGNSASILEKSEAPERLQGARQEPPSLWDRCVGRSIVEFIQSSKTLVQIDLDQADNLQSFTTKRDHRRPRATRWVQSHDFGEIGG
jgi:hypothetical protein